MLRLLLAILTVSILLGGASAQDWRADDENETRYNCDLVSALAEAYGGVPLLQSADEGIASLSEFLDLRFPACQATDADAAAESAAVIILESDEDYTIPVHDCDVVVDGRYDEDFNVSITGERDRGIAVDVYPPGADTPLVLDQSNEVAIVMGSDVPTRIEWAAGDVFPMGRYAFAVRIDDDIYHFEWERTDPAYRTFTITCLPDFDGEGETNALTDGEKKVISGTMCLVWTEAWDEDLNVLIIGEPQDDISVALTFPDQTEPEAMDDSSRSEFDDGQRYRVEWVAGRHFPLGEYSIDVTIEDERYQYTWQREDSDVNTVGVECINPEVAIPVDEFLAELEAAEAD